MHRLSGSLHVAVTPSFLCLQPLVQFNVSLRDALLLVLRKSLFSR